MPTQACDERNPASARRVASVSPDEKRRVLLPFLDVANGVLQPAHGVLDLADLLLGLARSNRLLVASEFADGFLDVSANGLRSAFYAIFVHLVNPIQSSGSKRWRPERSP